MLSFLTIAVATMQTPTAGAVILNIPASLDGTVTHDFNSSFMPGYPSTVSDTLDMTAAPFTNDLGAFTDMKVDLSVSPGQVIEVDLPSGKTGFVNVLLNYQGTLGSFNASESWPHTFQFLGLSGPAPTLTYDAGGPGRLNGNQIYVQVDYSFTSPFSFTGWEADFTGPFSSGGTMTYSATQHQLSVKYNDDVDGGQFVTIVPEPSTLALAVLGLLPLGFCRRQRRW